MISLETAIEIARQAISGKINLQEGSPVKVRRKIGSYVVTFCHINPPGTRGPDFDAQVTVDRKTGAVLKILGGS